MSTGAEARLQYLGFSILQAFLWLLWPKCKCLTVKSVANCCQHTINDLKSVSSLKTASSQDAWVLSGCNTCNKTCSQRLSLWLIVAQFSPAVHSMQALVQNPVINLVQAHRALCCTTHRDQNEALPRVGSECVELTHTERTCRSAVSVVAGDFRPTNLAGYWLMICATTFALSTVQ